MPRNRAESIAVQKAFGRLGVLAFYSGVGTKTPYGMEWPCRLTMDEGLW